jgi:hypothetical protein
MTARARYRGHEIEYVHGCRWQFVDRFPLRERPCAACGQQVGFGAPDYCLGKLRGVRAACCGHGRSEDAYIVFENGYTVRGEDALRLRACWTNHCILPTTAILVFTTVYDIDLTEEICKQADRGARPYDLIQAARIIENFRQNSFDFSAACDKL